MDALVSSLATCYLHVAKCPVASRHGGKSARNATYEKMIRSSSPFIGLHIVRFLFFSKRAVCVREPGKLAMRDDERIGS